MRYLFITIFARMKSLKVNMLSCSTTTYKIKSQMFTAVLYCIINHSIKHQNTSYRCFIRKVLASVYNYITLC